MPIKTSIRHVLYLFFTLMIFGGCGGGGGSGTFSGTISILDGDTAENTTSASDSLLNEIEGQFIDGPVAGLSYMCSSGNSGLTDSMGKFTCYEGNTVTFKVGQVLLGSIIVDYIITPISLHPNDAQAATNVARLLQSLDDDEDLSVITIDSSQIGGLRASLDVTSDTFEEQASIMLNTKTLVSKEDAIAHLNDNLNALSSSTAIASSGMAFVDHIPTPVITNGQGSSSFINNSDDSDDTSSPEEDGESDNNDSYNTSGGSGTNVSGDDTSSPEEDGESYNDDSYNTSGGSGTNVSGTDLVQNVFFEQSQECVSGGKAKQMGTVTDMDGKPLVGVKVNIAGCEQTTGSDGTYEFLNIVAADRTVINFGKDGYFRNSVIIDLKEYSASTSGQTQSLSPNHLKYAIDVYDNAITYDAQSSKTLIASTNAKVDMQGSVYVNTEGHQYGNIVQASIAYEDISTAKGKDAFPGAFEGEIDDDDVQFLSYGLITFQLLDSNGDPLSLSSNVRLTFPAITGMTAANIPLWYYDYIKGKWIAEGYASRQSDGSYEGTVGRAGSWSINDPVEDSSLGNYKGRMVYVGGVAVKDARVYAVGKNWISADVSIDPNGLFELKVIPDSDFTLKAYNYKYGYGVSYNGTLTGISSGETVQDRM